MEPRRVELTAVKSPIASEKKQRPKETLRFTLSLKESTDKAFSEFSFAELKRNVQLTRHIILDPTHKGDAADPFGASDRAEDDKLKALAAKFENKYGNENKNKRRPQNWGDVADLGDGYDLEDTFIDNTEAYDEVVPQALDTRFGGFYINSGQLEFKIISDDDDDIPLSNTSKRNKIESDSDVDDDDKPQNKKSKVDGDIPKKRKKLSTSDSTTKTLKKKKPADKNVIRKKKLAEKQPLTSPFNLHGMLKAGQLNRPVGNDVTHVSPKKKQLSKACKSNTSQSSSSSDNDTDQLRHQARSSSAGEYLKKKSDPCKRQNLNQSSSEDDEPIIYATKKGTTPTAYPSPVPAHPKLKSVASHPVNKHVTSERNVVEVETDSSDDLEVLMETVKSEIRKVKGKEHTTSPAPKSSTGIKKSALLPKKGPKAKPSDPASKVKCAAADQKGKKRKSDVMQSGSTKKAKAVDYTDEWVKKHSPVKPKKADAAAPCVTSLQIDEVASSRSSEDKIGDLLSELEELVYRKLVSNGVVNGNHSNPFADLDVSGLAAESQSSSSQETKVTAGLPVDLPVEVLEAVEKLKIIARDSVCGKSKFFTTDVNKLLLKVEEYLVTRSTHYRSQVHAYLCGFLPCGKQTLVKRAAKLVKSVQEDNINPLLAKLVQAIDKVMPSLVEKYTAECRAKEAAFEASKTDNVNGVEEDKKFKQTMLPRKKFEWNLEIRTLLADVMRYKMASYDLTSGENESASDFVRNFLDHHVRPLWPPGWIQTRMLFKETKAIHGKWTLRDAQLPKSGNTVAKPAPQSLLKTDASLEKQQFTAGDRSESTTEKAENKKVSKAKVVPTSPEKLSFATHFSSGVVTEKDDTPSKSTGLTAKSSPVTSPGKAAAPKDDNLKDYMAQYAQYLAVQNMYAAGLQETFVQEQLKLAMTTAGADPNLQHNMQLANAYYAASLQASQMKMSLDNKDTNRKVSKDAKKKVTDIPKASLKAVAKSNNGLDVAKTPPLKAIDDVEASEVTRKMGSPDKVKPASPRTAANAKVTAARPPHNQSQSSDVTMTSFLTQSPGPPQNKIQSENLGKQPEVVSKSHVGNSPAPAKMSAVASGDVKTGSAKISEQTVRQMREILLPASQSSSLQTVSALRVSPKQHKTSGAAPSCDVTQSVSSPAVSSPPSSRTSQPASLPQPGTDGILQHLFPAKKFPSASLQRALHEHEHLQKKRDKQQERQATLDLLSDLGVVGFNDPKPPPAAQSFNLDAIFNSGSSNSQDSAGELSRLLDPPSVTTAGVARQRTGAVKQKQESFPFTPQTEQKVSTTSADLSASIEAYVESVKKQAKPADDTKVVQIVPQQSHASTTLVPTVRCDKAAMLSASPPSLPTGSVTVASSVGLQAKQNVVRPANKPACVMATKRAAKPALPKAPSPAPAWGSLTLADIQKEIPATVASQQQHLPTQRYSPMSPSTMTSAQRYSPQSPNATPTQRYSPQSPGVAQRFSPLAAQQQQAAGALPSLQRFSPQSPAATPSTSHSPWRPQDDLAVGKAVSDAFSSTASLYQSPFANLPKQTTHSRTSTIGNHGYSSVTPGYLGVGGRITTADPLPRFPTSVLPASPQQPTSQFLQSSAHLSQTVRAPAASTHAYFPGTPRLPVTTSSLTPPSGDSFFNSTFYPDPSQRRY